MTLPDGQETPEAAGGAPGDAGAEQLQAPGDVSEGTTVPAAAASAEPPATTKVAEEATAAEKRAAKPTAERPARPAREAEPKEAPRVAPVAGSINELLAAAVPKVEMKAYVVPDGTGEAVAVEVARDDIPAVMAAARDDERLDLKYLRTLTGVDWQDEGLEVVYHLASLNKRHYLTVKTRVSYDDASVPSIAALYPAADWHERETRDMFGINFEGHPNLLPLLLPEDMTDHFPLRKDNPLQEIEEWQGIHLRDGAGDGDEE